MSTRACTANSKAFMALKHIYDNREEYALKWKAAGKRVVGVFGFDIPVEILAAGGFLPVQVYGDKHIDLTVADKYLEYAFDPTIRSQFEKMVDGTYAQLMDFVVMSRSSDALTRIFYYLREIILTEPEVPVPPIYFVEQFFLRNFDNQKKNITRYEKFRKTVEKWACRDISDEEIWAFCKLYNEDRQLMREFSALRYAEDAKVLGSEFLTVVGASMFMPVKEHIALMKELLADAESWDKVSGKKVFVTGTALEDTDFYELVEKLGGNVVSEDHDWGDRQITKDIDVTMINPERALVDRYWLRTPSTKHALIKDRVKSVVSDVERSHAAAALIYVHKYEESPSWDYPSQINGLKEINVPCLVLAKQSHRVEENVEAADKIAEFLKGGNE